MLFFLLYLLAGVIIAYVTMNIGDNVHKTGLHEQYWSNFFVIVFFWPIFLILSLFIQEE